MIAAPTAAVLRGRQWLPCTLRRGGEQPSLVRAPARPSLAKRSVGHARCHRHRASARLAL